MRELKLNVLRTPRRNFGCISEESREYLRITLDAIKDSVISLDLKGNITRMVEGWTNLCR